MSALPGGCPPEDESEDHESEGEGNGPDDGEMPTTEVSLTLTVRGMPELDAEQFPRVILMGLDGRRFFGDQRGSTNGSPVFRFFATEAFPREVLAGVAIVDENGSTAPTAWLGSASLPAEGGNSTLDLSTLTLVVDPSRPSKHDEAFARGTSISSLVVGEQMHSVISDLRASLLGFSYAEIAEAYVDHGALAALFPGAQALRVSSRMGEAEDAFEWKYKVEIARSCLKKAVGYG